MGWIPVAQDDTIYYRDVAGNTWRLEERVPYPKVGEPWTGIDRGTLVERLEMWTKMKLVPGDHGTTWLGPPSFNLGYKHYYAFVAV
jgi:hypothetical protein